LDILEMYKPDKDRIRAFWTQLQETWLALYGSSVPTAAAINVGSSKAPRNPPLKALLYILRDTPPPADAC